jgi:hypothetical protein
MPYVSQEVTKYLDDGCRALIDVAWSIEHGEMPSRSNAEAERALAA